MFSNRTRASTINQLLANNLGLVICDGCRLVAPTSVERARRQTGSKWSSKLDRVILR